ncbi:MAG: hypothetical protein JSV37_10225 [Anaerolineaceae bacterium]|nr:MAG: hypothetical protein JSV37_10225 [Anaerolineaceae bacterium]
MAVTRTDYSDLAVHAARQVLIELVHALGDYREEMIIIGGWVPELLYSDESDPHIGSIDVDLALDHNALEDRRYAAIEKILLERNYYRNDGYPFSYFRDVEIGGHTVTVRVDLMAGQYGGTGKNRRTQKAADVRARKARGCDLAFDLHSIVEISGELPGGAKDTVRVKVASVVPFLVMKGMALTDRMKEKDAYDIYYVVRYFPGGIDVLVKEIRPYAGYGLVVEGLGKIREAFLSPDHVGPAHVAAFLGTASQDERDRIRRDAFERVNALLIGLGF